MFAQGLAGLLYVVAVVVMAVSIEDRDLYLLTMGGIAAVVASLQHLRGDLAERAKHQG